MTGGNPRRTVVSIFRRRALAAHFVSICIHLPVSVSIYRPVLFMSSSCARVQLNPTPYNLASLLSRVDLVRLSQLTEQTFSAHF